jgi:hypothetical protein
VIFSPGTRFQTVQVPIINDNLVEFEEMFFGNLRLPAGSTALVRFSPDIANATIVDNDGEFIVHYYMLGVHSGTTI